MSNTKSRYPFATMDGKQIRLDVTKTIGTIKKAFATSGFTAEDLPTGAEILRLWADQDCWFLNANAVAVAPFNAVPAVIVNTITFIPASTYVNIAIDPEVLKYSVVRDTVDGSIMIQVLEKWNVLALEHQLATN